MHCLCSIMGYPTKHDVSVPSVSVNCLHNLQLFLSFLIIISFVLTCAKKPILGIGMTRCRANQLQGCKKIKIKKQYKGEIKRIVAICIIWDDLTQRNADVNSCKWCYWGASCSCLTVLILAEYTALQCASSQGLELLLHCISEWKVVDVLAVVFTLVNTGGIDSFEVNNRIALKFTRVVWNYQQFCLTSFCRARTLQVSWAVLQWHQLQWLFRLVGGEEDHCFHCCFWLSVLSCIICCIIPLNNLLGLLLFHVQLYCTSFCAGHSLVYPDTSSDINVLWTYVTCSKKERIHLIGLDYRFHEAKPSMSV